MSGASVTITVRVGEENKMFGSVTSQNISDALKEIGHEVSRKNIDLNSPIKELGTHDIRVKLYQEVDAHITVEVEGVDADGNKVEIIEEPEPAVETEVKADTEAEQEAETEEVEVASSEPEQEESQETEEVEAAASEAEQEETTEETVEENEEVSEEVETQEAEEEPKE